jgi:CIC family chloride channel protein
METDIAVLDESVLFSMFMNPNASGLRHVVVTRFGMPQGVIRVNADLRRGIGTVAENVTLGQLAQNDFIIADDAEAMYDVITEMSKQHAVAAVVMGKDQNGGHNIVHGIITKDYIADVVAGSIEIYAG